MRGRTAVAALMCLVGACGDNLLPAAGDSPDAHDAEEPRYEPWRVGATWTYTVTDNGTNMTRSGLRTTVLGIEDVGGIHAGVSAFRVRVQTYSGSKDVWEGTLGELDVRYKTVFYDAAGVLTKTQTQSPYRLKLDESDAHTTAGASFQGVYTETTETPGTPFSTRTKTERWQVIAVDEPITVAAGSFQALHVRRTNGQGNLQDYWYARGVGKLREHGVEVDEELTSFTP